MRRVPWAPLALVAALLVPAAGSRFYTFLANDVVIWALFATSLNLLVGYSGLVSFGHAAYFGIGAYATGLLMKKAALPFLLAFPAALSDRSNQLAQLLGGFVFCFCALGFDLCQQTRHFARTLPQFLGFTRRVLRLFNAAIIQFQLCVNNEQANS